jgi:hypothetical protein
MKRHTDGQIDIWTHRQTDIQMVRQMERWTDRQMDTETDGQRDRSMDTDRSSIVLNHSLQLVFLVLRNHTKHISTFGVSDYQLFNLLQLLSGG